MPYKEMKEKLKKKGMMEKSGLSNLEKDAKSSVLRDLSDQAGKAMAGKLSGLKKVSVASESPEGLKAGLEKAKELVGQMPRADEASEPEGEMSEEMEGYENMSPEELDMAIQELQALKAKKLQEQAS
jgi:hypothetical protein